ncbi:hypothetical protein SUGI_0093170 [Cryptomeria japonica]|nr:hypothetical protein SUGI_0093170 [Cryptomeria japonica]
MNNMQKLDQMRKQGKNPQNPLPRQVVIQWDVEDCGLAVPPPHPLRIFENIEKYLRGRGLHDKIITFFYSYGLVEFPYPDDHRREGIPYSCEPDKNGLYREMLKSTCTFLRGKFLLPPRIFFISANRDFTHALYKLKERCYPFVVAQINNNGELLEWLEMSSVNVKNSEPNICEDHKTKSFIEACNKTGISMIDNKDISVMKSIVTDVLIFSLDYPYHSTILLISGKISVKGYNRFRFVLNSMESELLIVVPDLKEPYCELNRDYSVWEWPQIVRVSHEGK